MYMYASENIQLFRASDKGTAIPMHFNWLFQVKDILRWVLEVYKF